MCGIVPINRAKENEEKSLGEVWGGATARAQCNNNCAAYTIFCGRTFLFVRQGRACIMLPGVRN